MENHLKEKLIEKINYDLEAQEDLERRFFEEERRERHKDDLACIGLMLIFVFVHIMTQAFQN
jgi:hypothetical protein